LRGRILDAQGSPLPGVVVTLRSASGAESSTTTDTSGAFAFEDLAAGTYDLNASLESFEPVVRRGLEVGSAAQFVALTLNLAVHQQVDVQGTALIDVLGNTQPNAPVTVTRDVMDVAMLPNSQFDDVLPLMPNVVRGPDGLISVGGARAESGGLFVNGVDASDPTIGGAGVMLPLDAVDSMQVYAGGAPAEYGHATGGMTSVQTRGGGDRFHMTADSFFPRLLYNGSGVSGVEFWDPNVGVSGPIVRGRLSYQQAISYRYDRNSYTTLAGDEHNLFTALLSWTQVDAQLSDRQRLRFSLAVDPRDTDRANVTAFTPAASAPRIKQGGWTAGVSDAITGRTVVLELRASAMRTGTSVTPYGSDPFTIGHELATGSYFDRQVRNGQRLESGAVGSWTPSDHQLVKAGATVDRSALDQSVAGAAIDLLRSDGSVTRSVAFGAAPPSHVAATTVSAFAQDNWSARPWLTLDVGVRADRTSAAAQTVASPRLGWSIGSNGGHTTLSGSAGLFADAVPLDALAFAALPARVVTQFDRDGIPDTTSGGASAPPVTYVNVVSPRLDVPRAARWNLQLDRRLGPWLIRARFEERAGQHELVVNPAILPSSTAAGAVQTVLATSGSSRSHSLETTAGFRSGDGSEAYVSYVHGSTFGDANTLAATEGLFRQPWIQANQRGPLPIDVPDRLLAWGIVHLPARFTVAPFLEARSGFPFTAIDDDWNIVGRPNAYRLPWMASLDLSANRIVPLPGHLPDARVGLKLYNVLSAHTDREVQRDIMRPDFGARYDPIPRDFSIVFEFLWGAHHQ
jgi:hypothetical protein